MREAPVTAPGDARQCSRCERTDARACGLCARCLGAPGHVPPARLPGALGCSDCLAEVWRAFGADPSTHVVVHDLTCPWAPGLLAGAGALVIDVERGGRLAHMMSRGDARGAVCQPKS